MSGYGSVARFYDGEYDGFRHDIDLCIERLRAERVRGAILEPGCGTGRVAVPLALAGFGVTGLDHSQAMLRRARRRRRALPSEVRLRLRFSCQDMTAFRFRRPFGAVVLAFSTFNLLPDGDSRRRCLERIADHLEPGGLLLADLFNPSGTAAGTRRRVTNFRLPPRGNLVEKLIEEDDDPAAGATRVRYTYQERRWHDDAVLDELEVEFTLARVDRRQMEALLYDHGFDVEAVFGDYRGRPAGDRSPRLVFQARKLA